jgi:hypothetical protein
LHQVVGPIGPNDLFRDPDVIAQNAGRSGIGIRRRGNSLEATEMVEKVQRGAESPQSNGMAEAPVKTLKRDYPQVKLCPVRQPGCAGSMAGPNMSCRLAQMRGTVP